MYASAQTNRLTSDWPISITSADAEILVSAIATRSRLRKAERDDDYFRNMLWLLENNIIGDLGIRLRCKARDMAVKTASKRPKLDTAVNEMVQEQWLEALTEDNCLVSRDRNGTEVQRLAVRCLARDGVILFRIWRGFPNEFGFALEPIEVDRLDHWWNRPAVGTSNEIKFGVERDEYKAAVAYWILTRHPGDVFAYSAQARYRERVPASDIIPIWTIERAGQSIGMPLWPSVAKRLQNLYGYEESEQIAARAGSAKGGWFERDAKTSGADEYAGPQDEQGNKLIDTAPGQWEELPVGFKAIINDPKHPTDQFPHFVKSQLRGVSAGGNLPYNSVASDLESINYSSYKAGMNDARDGFKYLQQLVTRKLMRRWYREWLPYAFMTGKVSLPSNDLDRIKKSDRWKPRRWSGLEPLKEVQADILAVEAGFDSQRNIIEENYDRDIEDVFDDMEHDQELAEEHGLDFSAANIKTPKVQSGPVSSDDSSTNPIGTDDQIQQDQAGARKNGHKNGNGNGNGHHLKDDMIRALKEQRNDFRTETAQPPSRRRFNILRDNRGTILGGEVEILPP